MSRLYSELQLKMATSGHQQWSVSTAWTETDKLKPSVYSLFSGKKERCANQWQIEQAACVQQLAVVNPKLAPLRACQTCVVLSLVEQTLSCIGIFFAIDLK